MTSFLVPALCVCCAVATGQVPGNANLPKGAPASGFVAQSAFAIDGEARGPLRPYVPQAGDLFMSTDKMFIIRAGHWLAGANSPHHSGIIFQKPDGQFCTLEAGPHNSLRVRALDMTESLSSYESAGNMVWVRRRSVATTQEQSQKLTEFAMAQDGKRFALFRMLGQLTPFRSRDFLGAGTIGNPHGARDSYFCAELVMESCGASGLLNPSRIHPCCTYPCDLFYGKSSHPLITETLDINQSWEPPSRWTRNVATPLTK